MHNILKIACLGLTLTAIGGCDLEDTDPRGGELADPIVCGGFAGLACPDGLTCVDAPDGCDPAKGDADCLGVCESAVASIYCGDFGGLACPDGLTCVDDPADDCDPANGGADCLGVCELAPIKHPPKHPPHPPKPPKPGK